jgi:multidrug resistance efflux pump
VLPTGVISKTGTRAQIADGNMADIKARRIVNLTEASLEDKRRANLWHTFYFTQSHLDNANRAGDCQHASVIATLGLPHSANN